MVTLALIFAYTTINIDPTVIIAALVGSYTPDIDCKSSKMGRVIPIHKLLIRHRGPMHSLFMLGMLTDLFMVISVSGGLGFGLGYGLHLLADMCTKMHLPYWNWYPGKHIKK